jgi:hypothetical protein
MITTKGGPQPLEGAGWELPEGGDVRQKGDVELRLSLATDQDPLRGAVADRIAEQLAEVGIAATVVRRTRPTSWTS